MHNHPPTVLEDICPLHILHECKAKNPVVVCEGKCMMTSLTTMGVCNHIGDEDTPKWRGPVVAIKTGHTLAKLLGHITTPSNTFISPLCNVPLLSERGVQC